MTALSNEELKAFVGPNHDYYLERWEDREGPRQGIRKFHWAAFFFNLQWLLYRRLFGYAGLIAAIYIAETILEILIFEGWLGYREAPAAVFGVTALIVGVATGSYANVLYLERAQREIEAVHGATQDQAAVLEELERRGGASFGGMLIGTIAWLLVLMLAMFCSYVVIGVVWGEA